MDVKVEIKGLSELETALRDAGPKLAKRAMRKALMAGGQVFENAAKAHAPVLKEGTPQRRPGELRDSIDTNVKLSPKEDKGVAHVGPKSEKGKGSEQPGVYGMFVEFGSIHGAAQPYLRPAFDEAGTQAQEAFAEQLRIGLEALRKK